MAELEQWAVERPWLALRCALGEGPFYERETNSVRFVDIKKRQLHGVSLAEGPASLQTMQLDACPTVASDIEGDEMLRRFGEPADERLRSNDGAADPHGSFWPGSMTDSGLGEFQREGSLHRSTETDSAEMVTGLRVPSSILAWDYDACAGAPSNERLFYQHRAHGGEGRVLKASPRGQVVGQFVGTDLVVTSAADEAGDADAGSRAHGGAVFKVHVGTTGLEPFKFRMQAAR
ncbi:Regucalcin [Tolypocladium paradoxum]|uniref:Regucalcin n=1 Tax=Tolypocladium paradoxum TaxID=94208 RepID=A0A2S4L5C0_9HYPO|nr:Regucalcin [Tolypocladium paradoxum]